MRGFSTIFHHKYGQGGGGRELQKLCGLYVWSLNTNLHIITSIMNSFLHVLLTCSLATLMFSENCSQILCSYFKNNGSQFPGLSRSKDTILKQMHFEWHQEIDSIVQLLEIVHLDFSMHTFYHPRWHSYETVISFSSQCRR